MKTLRRYISKSPEETAQIGIWLGKALIPGDIVLLHGELGAGKSVFARGLARGVGVMSDTMPSPTFTLMQVYAGRMPFYHMDLYRLSRDEFERAGLSEYLYGDGAAAVEWPDRAGAIAPPRIDVRIQQGAFDNERVIEIKPASRVLII